MCKYPHQAEPKKQQPSNSKSLHQRSSCTQQKPPPIEKVHTPNYLLARMKTTVRIIKVQPQLPQGRDNNMASHSNRTPQVRPQPYLTPLYPLFLAYNTKFIKIEKCNVCQKKHKKTRKGTTQRYKIVRYTLKTQIQQHTKTKGTSMLTLKRKLLLHLQDEDQDMADSNSLNSHKRSQLIVHPYTSQTLWLGF